MKEIKNSKVIIFSIFRDPNRDTRSKSSNILQNATKSLSIKNYRSGPEVIMNPINKVSNVPDIIVPDPFPINANSLPIFVRLSYYCYKINKNHKFY